MIKSYLTLALRIMIGQRGFVFINLSGLTIGIACSLLLFLYIQDELSFDRFHPDADRTFRIGFESKLQGHESISAETGSPLAAALQKSKAVESVIRIANWPTFPIRYQGRAFTEPYLLLADSNFFFFFRFELVAGDPEKVLNQPDQLVLSESAARKYFDYKGPGDTSPIGKTMVLAQGYNAKVVGIAKDAPLNSHFHYTVILSIKSWTELSESRWINGVVHTYFKLADGATTDDVQRHLESLIETDINEELKETYQTTLHQFEQQGNYLAFFTQPLVDIHLKSRLADEIEQNGNIQYIYLFGTIAVFITILACINFMNLSTARSANRAKEVGVRKAVGALQSRLISQFLFESMLFTLAAVAIALGIIRMVLLPFNLLTEKQIQFSILFQPTFLTGIVLFITLVGLLAGSYPAFFLARYSPVEVLKGRARIGRKKYGIRNTLVIFQFFISITLMAATLVVYQQLRFIQNQSTGFDKSNIVNLLHTANLLDKAPAFKQEMASLPGVVSCSFANRLPPNIDWQSVFRIAETEKDHLLSVYEMDGDHLKTMGYVMAAGRYFSPTDPNDKETIILNQTAARQLGVPLPLGDSVFISSTYDSKPGARRRLIGVMKDFNFKSLKEPIQPLAIVLSREPNWEMAIRIQPDNREETIKRIQTVWKKYAPNAPFELTFVEDNFNATYQREARVGSVFLIFTILAIFIACLGVFGLAIYMAEQRTKEIGIRKVLGATSWDVVQLLTIDFAKLILIAFLIAAPLSWWILDWWLDQFAYHINIPVYALIMSAFLALVLALASASHRAIKAALSNPVDSLRTE